MIQYNNFEIIKKEDFNTYGKSKAFHLSSKEKENIYVRKLITNGKYYYSFGDDGTVEDFIKITNSIKSAINPDNIEYKGISDIVGFFEKEGIKIDLLHIETYEDNILIVDPTLYSNEKIDIIDKWMVIINNEMNSNLNKESKGETKIK